MNTRDLEVFEEVYKYQNITKAAAALFLSPQSVSKTIRKLENELGVKLFEKTISGSLPTEEAELLYSHAQKIMDDFVKLQDIFSGTEQERKTIKIASTTGVFRKLGLEFIIEFHERYPFLKLEIIENLDPEVDALCWNEAVDLCFNSLPFDHNRFHSRFVLDDPYACILHKDHPLAKKIRLTIKIWLDGLLLFRDHSNFSLID